MGRWFQSICLVDEEDADNIPDKQDKYSRNYNGE
jgi:hypothetical protein